MRLEEVKIYSKEANEVVLFYKNMGATVDHVQNEFHIQIGSSKLIIAQSEKNWRYHLAFNIAFDQVETASKWLKKFTEIQPFEGEEIVEFPNWEARAVYFYDPAGNILELIGRKPFQKTGKPNFDFDSILNISEVGWPVKNNASAQEQLPFHVYSQFGEYFSAMGDAEGLFIVVDAEEKQWIPNNDPVEFSPCEVIASTGPKRYRIIRSFGQNDFSVERL